MANKSVFKSTTKNAVASGTRPTAVPAADTKNSFGGQAYEFTPEHALAQLATTGTFQSNASLTGEQQLAEIKKAADKCSPEFIAQVAIYARQIGFMKDMPAALAVILSKADPALLDKVFDRIIDNGKQLRNFVQIIRSGTFGRRSLGSGPARLIERWLNNQSDASVFRASVGNSPSLADVIRLVHPSPQTESRRALYGYILGNEPAVNGAPLVEEFVTAKGRVAIKRRYDPSKLPDVVKHFEAFKAGDRSQGIPNVDFRQLTSAKLSSQDWAEIAKSGGWHQTRMNLNTYTRHGVFQLPGMTKIIADKLTDVRAIQRSKVFPYQLLAAFVNTGNELPAEVRLALQMAMELATGNVPAIAGKVSVIVDVSGSMGQSVTGYGGSATSKVTCLDVAALVAATILRKNPYASVIPVDTAVRSVSINPLDTIMTNARKLAINGGGTDLSAAMRHIEATGVPDLIVMVSDNESWYGGGGAYSRGTRTMESFCRMQAINKDIKMVCLDIVANTNSQASSKNPGVMNIGGFSDLFWPTVSRFVAGDGPSQWVEQIKQIDLNARPTRPAADAEGDQS